MFIKKNIYFEDDSSLWNKFLKGDDDAYEHIYKKYANRLFLQGLRFTSDRELIKDCLQDVFVKIYKNRTNLGTTDNIKLYLFISLKNTILNTLKKSKVYFDPLDENMENEYTFDNNTAENELIGRETESLTQNQINNVLNILTARQKEAIHYRFIEGMTIDEICVLMEMNYQSVQNLLQRSIKKIKENLKIV
ncbi:sigma-70 family RNA polymerase sigma factor [Dysgonomonas sp. Marseille-P4677]|uniref:RNA polymerase sigma factor n=1 Tax=Dysgonomonas sp. Marseille-P4677 TaxID=2364790 RepID=UPI0019125ACA|nr:sigma-70 family RNA polymerase sigma factor [Dysgonomonas sp. Marseille-P4677]MBK5723107.1 sigma-70 family RNA polymerase sigma factor [Dysgonomonas sp. Marseille-P4677]